MYNENSFIKTNYKDCVLSSGAQIHFVFGHSANVLQEKPDTFRMTTFINDNFVAMMKNLSTLQSYISNSLNVKA